ncbi:cell wall hydrolase [Chelatococcus sp. SYSU_G07232]|uniref:Cell wall hydrolase n=1 Tax=Chelatococcus albus TaxID=3047466 RepID=A0ABT7AEK7_9HYPH|nr:cell wall hydrolase [Chelatococcus sp. SYSU_G07232]MDJ1157804.1 cell wall hydrolase [Chelatococcus sp. SYSU_G07232]
MCATVTPWALAAGALVSFTASAGQDPSAGASAAARVIGEPSSPTDLVPRTSALAAAAIRLPGVGLASVVRSASLSFEEPIGDAPAVPGVPPRADLKSSARGYPQVDRSRKGDPIVALRPTLSRRALDVRAGHGDPAHVVFSRDERMLPPTILMPGSVEIPATEAMFALEPWSRDEMTATEAASAPLSPLAPGGHGTTPAAVDGSTPPVSRAAALASSTPAPADLVPVEIAAAPVSLPPGGVLGKDGYSVAMKADERPRYADLIDPENMTREQRCLAEAVYFEARGENEEGQAAVAQVVLNRVKSGLYPSTVCGVVYQNRHRYKACQFSFACEGRSLRITEPGPWRAAVRIAREVTEGKTYLAEVGGATHYHADYVRPYWAKRLKKMDVIGRHIFYKLRPGQT